MIRVQFENQIDELRAGLREIDLQNGRLSRLKTATIGSVILVLLTAVFVWVRRVTASVQEPLGSVLLQTLAVLLLPTLFWVLSLFHARRRSVRKSHPALGRILTLDVDTDLLAISDATQRTERRWSGFQKFVETRDFFLLFTAPKAAVILPKRIFDAASLDEFRRLAQTQITPPIRGFPVISLAERSQAPDQSR
jgi:hypothetical protein